MPTRSGVGPFLHRRWTWICTQLKRVPLLVSVSPFPRRHDYPRQPVTLISAVRAGRSTEAVRVPGHNPIWLGEVASAETADDSRRVALAIGAAVLIVLPALVEMVRVRHSLSGSSHRTRRRIAPIARSVRKWGTIGGSWLTPNFALHFAHRAPRRLRPSPSKPRCAALVEHALLDAGPPVGHR